MTVTLERLRANLVYIIKWRMAAYGNVETGVAISSPTFSLIVGHFAGYQQVKCPHVYVNK